MGLQSSIPGHLRLRTDSALGYSHGWNCRGRQSREMTEGWLDFIINCRHGEGHSYDIVISAMANDQIYNYIADYMDGIITREQFWVMARFKYPTHQVNFCTDAALECLRFQSCENAVV